MNRPLQWTMAAALMLAAMADGHPRAAQTTRSRRFRHRCRPTWSRGEFANSIVYPGTWREDWVYVPRELDRSKPAPVMVFQDGLQYGAPASLTISSKSNYYHCRLRRPRRMGRWRAQLTARDRALPPGRQLAVA